MKTCGVDVHKDNVFCAIYNGKAYSEVKEYDTTTPKIRRMGEYLRAEGVQRVAMDSTSTYRVPVWDILYEMGFELMLVNPFLIKQMPGRKSDVKDAQWIACLLHKRLLRGSMIPSPVIQQLQKMDRIMVMCGFRISICDEHFSKEMELVQSIPGVSERSAMIIIAETGGDMRVFETSGKITGWAGLRPRNDESAGKYKSANVTCPKGL